MNKQIKKLNRVFIKITFQTHCIQQTDDERVVQGEKLLHDLIFGIMDGIIPTLQAHQQLKKDNRRRQVGYSAFKNLCPSTSI